MTTEQRSLITNAAHAARRFQLMARLHLDRTHTRALHRDAQALCDALARLGFRPGE